MAQIKSNLKLSGDSKDKNIGLEGIKKRNDHNHKINDTIEQHLKLIKRSKIHIDFIRNQKIKEIQIEQNKRIKIKKQTLIEKKNLFK